MVKRLRSSTVAIPMAPPDNPRRAVRWPAGPMPPPSLLTRDRFDAESDRDRHKACCPLGWLRANGDWALRLELGKKTLDQDDGLCRAASR